MRQEVIATYEGVINNYDIFCDSLFVDDDRGSYLMDFDIVGIINVDKERVVPVERIPAGIIKEIKKNIREDVAYGNNY